MSNQTYTARPPETLGSDALAELALDLRWSFNHATDAIWERLDAELWHRSHNPWLVLQTVSQAQLDTVKADADFQRLLEAVIREQRQVEASPGWFQRAYAEPPFNAVAYFSMEFMLSEALPIYSGGLGNVAGDQLKAASNLSVPLIGVGLLYQQGYFRQQIDAEGRQQAVYPFNDPAQLPIRPLRDASGAWMRSPIALPGSTLWIRAWQVQVGRVRLYLLDTNGPENTPANRSITSELYGGDAELRLRQEIVLGIGGWRLLRAIGVQAEVCHLNEGHAALAVLERARTHMVDHSRSFELALTITRAGTLFTTHTAVDAGFDRFAPELLAKYLASYAEHELRIPLNDLLALGRANRDDEAEPFNMAYLAIRGSGAVNGVSRLHGAVSRRIMQPLFPRCPTAEVPIGHITNGVHMPTWDSAEADRLWETACGKERWRWTMQDVARGVRQVSDDDLWQLRTASRRGLLHYVREQVAHQVAAQGGSAVACAHAATILDPWALTLGFARRFATYKRPNLLLHDTDRLARILADRQRPVQLVIAGKAHPEDRPGQALIAQWIAFVNRPDVEGRAVFLSDHDMLMAERLVQGVDLWINTPRRPWEACGTSGMKVLVNGGLNLSELDGWWAEAYTPAVGWALGDGQDRGDDPAWDAAEAIALYELLEGQVVPEFYARDSHGIPRRWVERMRESMAQLTPVFSANRAVREYTESHYQPLAAAHRARAANNGQRGADLLAWRHALERGWGTAAFRDLDVHAEGAGHVFRVRVDLGTLALEEVQVELFADGEKGGAPWHQPMTRVQKVDGSGNEFVYTATVAASRPATDFTPRLVPCYADASVPLEAPFVRWCELPARSGEQASTQNVKTIAP